MAHHTFGTSAPSDVLVSPDGTTLYAGGSDGILRVYNAQTGALLHSDGLADLVIALSVADGHLIGVGDFLL